MQCPKCKHIDTKVIDSRPVRAGQSIRRRRICPNCNFRFTTYEILEAHQIRVDKGNGRFEMFNPEKIQNSILKACSKLGIDPNIIEEIVSEICLYFQEQGEKTVEVSEICQIIASKLKYLNSIAYIRYVSENFNLAKYDELIEIVKEAGEVANLPYKHPELSFENQSKN
ncbi:MAG: transcriptional regulator NrdR [Chthoniobacterales bacterium]|nr:transcriptional regulator NrdR [Chthoniobacterales bacterium]